MSGVKLSASSVRLSTVACVGGEQSPGRGRHDHAAADAHDGQRDAEELQHVGADQHRAQQQPEHVACDAARQQRPRVAARCAFGQARGRSAPWRPGSGSAAARRRRRGSSCRRQPAAVQVVTAFLCQGAGRPRRSTNSRMRRRSARSRRCSSSQSSRRPRHSATAISTMTPRERQCEDDGRGLHRLEPAGQQQADGDARDQHAPDDLHARAGVLVAARAHHAQHQDGRVARGDEEHQRPARWQRPTAACSSATRRTWRTTRSRHRPSRRRRSARAA